MKNEIIPANYLKTICWVSNTIIDWASGKQYFMNGGMKEVGAYHYSFSFDTAISSDDGKYSFIYQKLGTKGLLLKEGELLREINRSYYFAGAYQFIQL